MEWKRIVQAILCVNAFGLCGGNGGDDSKTSIGQHGQHMGYLPPGTDRYLLSARPFRGRRPGGLSYETSDVSDPERRAIALIRRQLKNTKRLGKAISKFGDKLVKNLYAGNVKKDVVVSPLSIHMALTMLSVGAKDSNLKELYKVTGLRKSRVAKGQIHHAYFTLINQLFRNNQALELFDVLGVFVKPNIPLEMAFRQTVSQFYNGHFGTLPPNPAVGINHWTSSRSQGELSASFLSPGSTKGNEQMLLVSGMCVKGYWDTLPRRESNMLNVEQTMMVKKMEIPDSNLRRLQVVLSRGESNKTSDLVLDIVQLSCNSSVQDAVEVLANRKYHKILQRQPAKSTRLIMPKFQIRHTMSGSDFKGVMKRLKMRKSFSKKKANFQGISSTGNLYLQKVFHKSVIQFNKYGIGCNHPLTLPGFSSRDTVKQLRKLPPGVHDSPEMMADMENQVSRPLMSKNDLPREIIDRGFVFAVRETRYGVYLTTGVLTGDRLPKKAGGKHC